jgi:hypothetical protein
VSFKLQGQESRTARAVPGAGRAVGVRGVATSLVKGMKVVGLADRFAPSGCPRIRIGNTNSSWMDIAPLARRRAVVFSCGLATAETSVGASRQSLRHWINCPMRRLSTARSSRWTKTESHSFNLLQNQNGDWADLYRVPPRRKENRENWPFSR